MTKTIAGAPMPATMEASFALYRVVGLVDGAGNTESDDLLVDDYLTVYDPAFNGGQSILTVDNLELGQYYLKELNAPAGYVTLQGPLPENPDGSFGFTLSADAQGNAVPALFTVDNLTASSPTINKQISSATRPIPSSEEYDLSMGETIRFWLNVAIPDPMDAAGSMVIRDPLSPWLQIQGISVSRGADIASMTLDSALTDRVHVNFATNEVTLALNGGEVTGGETVSLQIDVRVLPNTNLYEAGALENGSLVNTGYLDYTDGGGILTTDTSTVHLDPVIQRDLRLTKVLGDYTTPLTGARFQLTQVVADGETPLVYIADSNTDGVVYFNDVQEGVYKLHETRYPAGYLPMLALMNEGATVSIGMDIVFTMPPTNTVLIPDPALGYVIPNNEKITVSGAKTWDDLNNQRLSRPASYSLLLRRRVMDGTPGGTLDGEFGKRLTLPSTTLNYSYADTVSSATILKYQPNTFYPYEYYIEETVPFGYTAAYDGMNVTNTLKTAGALPLLKMDGDTAQMIPGIAFQLTSTTRNPDGSPVYQHELTTDAGGRLEFTGLNPGTYTLHEVYNAASSPYIVSDDDVLVTIHEDLSISLYPNKYAYQAEPSGYIIKNYRRPVPTKTVLDETGNPATTLPYPVDPMGQPVTYRIALPLQGVEDINQLRIIDTVDPSMSVVPDSWVKYDNGTPYYVTDSAGNPVYGFEALLTGQGQNLAFQIQNIADISQLAGKTLYFEFKAYVSTSAETFAALNPDMTTSNTALLILNEDLRNTEISNDAQTAVTLYQADVTKYAQVQGGAPRLLRPGESAAFALYQVIGARDADPLVPTDDRYIGTFTTGADSMLHLTNLDVGEYALVETRAPLGYRRAAPTYFSIASGQTGPLALSVENPLPYPSQLFKRVSALNLDGTPAGFIAPTADPAQESMLALSHLHDGFVYQITGILPSSMEGYLRLRFTDMLPYGVVADRVELVVGGMNGDTFVPMFTGTSPNPAGNQAERMLAAFAMNPAYPQTLTFFQGDPAQLMTMQGMAYQLYVYAHIDNAISTTEALHLVDGKITNTATFAVNSDTVYTDIASVIPPPLFGMRITKMGDRLNALGVPDQYLADSAFILSAEPGSSLPANYGAIQASDAMGQLTFLNSLEPGTYTLFEIAAPAGFMAEYPYHEVTIGLSGAMTVQPYRLEEDADGTPVRVDAAAPLAYTGPDADGYFSFTVENREVTSAPVYKTWTDLQNSGDTRPDQVYLFLLRRVVSEQPDGYTVSFTNPEAATPQAPAITPVPSGAPDAFDTSFYSWVKLDKYQTSASFQNVTGPLYLRDEAGKLYDYFIVEAGPLDPAEAPSTFEMPVRGYTTVVDQSSHTVTNTLNTAALTLSKLDATDGTALAGAEFRVSHLTDTGLSTWVYTSGTNGQINLADLLPLSRAYFSDTTVEQTSNVYTIQEIKPPLGYLADTTVYTAVVDEHGAISLYSHYEGAGSPNNAPAVNFTAGVGGGTLPVDNAPMVIPPIQKLVNGGTGAVLNDLHETVAYSLSIPIRETSGFTSMLIEDLLPQGMEFVSTPDTVTVTDEAGRDIKGLGTLSLQNGLLSWAVGSNNMGSLTNHTVNLQFEARVADTQTITTLIDSGVYVPNRGIANDAAVTFNGDPLSASRSEAVYIIPASDVPTITKQVNGANYYNMASNDDALTFEMKVPLPTEISNYQSLSIADAFEPAFLVNPADVTLYAVTYNPDGTEATRTTLRKADNELGLQQYTLSNINGAWTAAFVDGFDFTTLSGQTLLLQVSATLNRDADLSGYIDPDGIIRIENTATAKVNTETITSNTVSVTPPAVPVIQKLVNGQEELVLTSGSLEDSFAFDIVTTLPFNTAGFDIIEIRDVIPPYLVLQGSPEVYVDGVASTAVSAAYDANTHTLTAILDKAAIPLYSGSDIAIRFVATIDQTRLTSASRIDNTAEVLLNGLRTSQSTASILPTTGQATLTKSLDQAGSWPAGETAVFTLERFVNGIYVLINDQLTVSGTNNPLSLGELIIGTYRLTETRAPGGYLTAPPVTFVITGVVPDGQTVENVQVAVTDSMEPSITKTADKTYLGDFSDTVTYTVEAQVHAVLGMSELVIEDVLDSQFQYLGASAVTVPGGTSLTDDYLTYDAVTRKVRLYLPQAALGLVENQTVRLTVAAALKEDFSYAQLGADAKANGIPNYAIMVYNADPQTLEVTDTVYVKVPVGGISLTKTGDGLPLASGLAATFNLYKVVGLTDGDGNTETDDVLLGNHETPIWRHPGRRPGARLILLCGSRAAGRLPAGQPDPACLRYHRQRLRNHGRHAFLPDGGQHFLRVRLPGAQDRRIRGAAGRRGVRPGSFPGRHAGLADDAERGWRRPGRRRFRRHPGRHLCSRRTDSAGGIQEQYGHVYRGRRRNAPGVQKRAGHHKQPG